MSVTVLDDLDGSDTLLLGLVGKHGAEGNISDTFDTLNGGVELVVDHNSSPFVGLDTNVLKTKVLGVGSSTDSNEDNVGFKLDCEHGNLAAD